MQTLRLLAAAIPSVLLSGIALLHGPADAATFTIVDRSECIFYLDGPIEPGDADRLRAAASRQASAGRISLCLNSPGGNYAEGLRIIGFILNDLPSFRTVVDKGDECVSVCALIFLSGHQKAGRRKLPDRKLHSQASLGFHGPYIKPGTLRFDPLLAPAAHAAGLKAVGQLIALDEEALFPLSLLAAGLEKGEDEFMYIETIDQVGAWAIDLLGYHKPDAFTPSMLNRACRNFDSWNISLESPLDHAPGDAQDPDPATLAAIEFVWGGKTIEFRDHKFHKEELSGYGYEGTWNCYVDGLDAGAKGIFFKVQIGSGAERRVRDAAAILQREVANRSTSPTGPGTPLWYIYDPRMKLSAIVAD